MTSAVSARKPQRRNGLHQPRAAQPTALPTFEAGPGPRATPARALKANTDALALLRAIVHLNLPAAADYVQRNPPSPDAIARLAFLVNEVITSARGRHSASHPRPNSLQAKIRAAGVQCYAEVRAKAPALLDQHSKRAITNAISKVKSSRKSP